MNRRGTHHRSVARSAPFGTDIQPKLDVKIIGGVTVEVPFDKPHTDSSSHKGSGSSLRDGPHGTPPIQNQPLNVEYIHEQHSRVATVSSQHDGNIATVPFVHPITSPSDSSNSHIHISTDRRRNSFPNPHRVLPPISSRRSVDQEIYASPPKQPPQRSLSDTAYSHHTTLHDHLRPHLADYDPQRFKEMYTDLAEFDRKLSGYVSHGQFSLATLKHGLPIPTPSMKLLLSSFSHEADSDLINYEKLIQYLARVQLGTATAETLLEEAVKRFVDSTEDTNGTDQSAGLVAMSTGISQLQPGNERSHERLSAPLITERKQTSNINREEQIRPSRKPLRTFPKQEDAKFLSLLRQQYVLNGDDSDPPDFDAMREKFKEVTGSDCASSKQIEQVCLLSRVPVQGSLMDKLLLRCDTGSGLFSWPEFISYLENAQSEPSPANNQKKSPYITDDRPVTWPSVQETHIVWNQTDKISSDMDGQPVWEQRKPLGRLEIRSPRKNVSDVEEGITRYDTPHNSARQPEQGTPDQREDAQLAQLAEEQQRKREERERAVLQKQQMALHPDDEPWFDRFMHLARGVYNSDSSNSGFLDIDEMLRLINNYNLIYQLGLPTPRIQSVVASQANGASLVPIEPILANLRLEKPK